MNFIKAEFLKMVKNVARLSCVLRWQPDLLQHYSQPCLCLVSRDHWIMWVIHENNVISQCLHYIVSMTSILITCILKDYQLSVYPYSQLKMMRFYCFLRHYLFIQHFYIYGPKSPSYFKVNAAYMTPSKHKYLSLYAKWMDLHF